MTIRVLLVSDIHNRSEMLEDALEEARYHLVATIGSRDDILTLIKASQPDVLLVYVTALKPGLQDQIKKISKDYPLPIVMFVDHSNRKITQESVKVGISAFIVNGLARDRIAPVIELAIARYREVHNLKEELEKTKESLNERKVIERAKGMLMKQHKLAEDEAFRAMQKTAMSRNMKILDVAKNIISINEAIEQGS